MTFADLHDRLTAAGAEVGVERSEGDALGLVVRDWAGAREIRLPARDGDLDRAARVLAFSAAIREACGDGLPAVAGRGKAYVGRWPELAA